MSELHEPGAVAAVVPAYNAARFLEATLEGILDQSAPVAECVVVDDGSTDGTGDLAEGFDSRVRVVRQPNRGVSAARNAGARAASSPLLAFCDADDVWLPEKQERQLETWARSPEATALFTGAQAVGADLEEGAVMPAPTFEAVTLKDMIVHRTGWIPPQISSTLLVQRETLKRTGGWDESLAHTADWDQALRLRKLGPFAGPTEPLVLYRRHEGSMSRRLELLEAETRALFRKVEEDPELRDAVAGSVLEDARAWNWSVVAASLAREGHMLRAARWWADSFSRSPGAALKALARRREGRKGRAPDGWSPGRGGGGGPA